MTVCNMTIEGGGRAGMIAPDETTFAWVARARRQVDDPTWRDAARPTTARRSTREIIVDATALSPQVTWGTTPEMVVGVTDAVPEPPGPTATSARCTTWTCEAGTPIQEITLDRVFIGSCTNTRIGDLRAAAEVVEGRKVAARRRRDGRPGLRAGQGAGRGRGPRRGLPRRRLRLARRGLLDVPGHEPRHRRARRALRLDVEPQLRGPPGPRRPHAPRLARRWPPRPPSRATSSTSGSGAERMEADRDDHRARSSVLERDDVDTDQIIPKQFLKRVERTGFGEFLFYDWAKEPGWDLPRNPILVTGAQLRLRLQPRARAVGASRTTASRRSSRRRSPTSSRRTARRSGCCRSQLPPTTVEAIAEAGEAQVDLDAQEVRWAGGTRALRDRPRDQAPAAQRPRRHRADARSRTTRSPPTSATASAPARSRPRCRMSTSDVGRRRPTTASRRRRSRWAAASPRPPRAARRRARCSTPAAAPAASPSCCSSACRRGASSRVDADADDGRARRASASPATARRGRPARPRRAASCAASRSTRSSPARRSTGSLDHDALFARLGRGAEARRRASARSAGARATSPTSRAIADRLDPGAPPHAWNVRRTAEDPRAASERSGFTDVAGVAAAEAGHRRRSRSPYLGDVILGPYVQRLPERRARCRSHSACWTSSTTRRSSTTSA